MIIKDLPKLNQISIGSNSFSKFYDFTISTPNNLQDLQNLLNSQFRSVLLKNVIINENSCNNLNGDWILSGFDNLEKIIVKKNSLQNLNMLKICNNKQLKTIEIENGDSWNAAFLYVNNMVIQGI